MALLLPLSSSLLLNPRGKRPPSSSPSCHSHFSSAISSASRQTASPSCAGAAPPSSDRLLSCSSSSSPCSSSYRLNPPVSSRGGLARRRAVGDGPSENIDGTVYKGVYGPWTVDADDVREVVLYRSGLVTAATTFVVGASSVFIPDGNIFGEIIKDNLDLLYIIGAGSLGVSLLLIHIYVTFIKRSLQALWALGAAGSLAAYLCLAQPQNESLAQYVIENAVAVWFVGPVFASLTGLVFKEGLCYGKLEAGILTFVIPSLLLGHLSGLMNDGVERSLLGLWMILFVVFAARKFTQPIKDDIGDKSVFMFNDLSEGEKKALLQRLEQQSDDNLE